MAGDFTMARVREAIEIARQRQDDDEWRAILRLLEAYERDPDNEKGELAPAAATAHAVLEEGAPFGPVEVLDE